MDDPFELTPMTVALEALLRLHAKVDYVIELLEEEAGDERIDAETKARWAGEDAQLRRFVDHRLRSDRERANRRRRLRRLSFGLLGR